MNAAPALAAVILGGLVAFGAFLLVRPRVAVAGDSSSGDTSSLAGVGGLWGLLNEGPDSNPFLPSPDLPVTTPTTYDDTVANNAPRGIRNRNPGNVKRSLSNWLGKIPWAQSTDSTFEQFVDAKYGIRVIAYLLLKYQQDKGKRTVRQLIAEPGGWAPTESDRNPAGYATFVARAMGIAETDYVDLFANDRQLEDMVAAIIQFENGQQPYADMLRIGVQMARAAFS